MLLNKNFTMEEINILNNSQNSFLLQKVESIEDLEDLGLSDESDYLNKIKFLQEIASPTSKDVQKVWGEYSTVSQITSQPVLMNKAMSIALTKDGVADLIEELNDKYKKELSLISHRKKVDLLFGATTRGHAKSENFQIVLPKLGDWRFGYTNLYSSEVVFHEFSHTLDFLRNSQGAKGKSDVHKHDFVRILDKMLLMYADWINSKYVPLNQREQILTNNSKLIHFHQIQDELELQIAGEEYKQEKENKQKQSDIYSTIGLTENSFPLSYILGENADRKIEFIKFGLNEYKNQIVSQKSKDAYKTLLEKLDSENIILNKDEISLIIEALQKASRNKFVYSLPMSEQLKSGSYISKFQKDLESLALGVVESLQETEKYKVRSYDEARRLKDAFKFED